MQFTKMKLKNPAAISLKHVNVEGDKIVIDVTKNEVIRKGQEIFVVAQSTPKTQFNRIKKMNDVIVRAKVESVDGNSLTLSSVPEYIAVVEAQPIINRFIKKSVPVYVEGIEKW